MSAFGQKRTLESVSNGRRKSFTGPLGVLPDGRVGVVGADDFEEPFALAGLGATELAGGNVAHREATFG